MWYGEVGGERETLTIINLLPERMPTDSTSPAQYWKEKKKGIQSQQKIEVACEGHSFGDK